MDTRPMHRAKSDSSPKGLHQPALVWGNPCVWDSSRPIGIRQVEYPKFFPMFNAFIEVNLCQLVNTFAQKRRDAIPGRGAASRPQMPGDRTSESPAASVGLRPVGSFLLRVGVSTLWLKRRAS